MSIEIPALLPVISDFVFKLIFGDQRNIDILLEIQVWPIPEMKQRSIYFMSKMVTEQKAGSVNQHAKAQRRKNWGEYRESRVFYCACEINRGSKLRAFA